jgi:gliding motility-associated-like protein
LLGLATAAEASHIRAGDIQAKSDTTAARNPLRIFFKMVIYTDPTTGVAHTDPDADIFFGDNTHAVVSRTSHVNIGNNIYRDVYYFDHTYNAAGRYLISYLGEYRAGNIRNVPASDTRSFYIHTEVAIDPVLGPNHSPVLNHPAVDRAISRRAYEHNPAASDADHDSLAFKLRICQYEPRSIAAIVASPNKQLNPQNLPGFAFPHVASGGNQVPYAGPPVGDPNQASILVMDPLYGQMLWNAPNQLGDYNVAFVVEEWRRLPNGGRRKMGEVVRDMQITVYASPNVAPALLIPRDTCVVAGTTIERNVRATDPDGDRITLSAFGGALPPATFVQTSNLPGRATGRFRWTTSCSDVASNPQIILFKAEDQPASGPSLATLRPWLVTVIGPPPTNLRAALQGSAARLSWDPYFCQNASRIRIYRKENPSGWNPSDCETGIPASAGYTEVGQVTANLATFLDDNGGRGLDRGKTYCYRIYAEFPRPAGGASLASQEACVTLLGRPLLVTNVSVDRTDAVNGQITVKWTRPAPVAAFLPPFGYRLYRATGTTFTLVRAFSNLDDTVHVDPSLNTRDNAYSYRVEFFHTVVPGGPEVVEQAGPASSVRLALTPNPGRQSTIEVRWTYNVPWDNRGSRTRVYRQSPGNPAFVLLTAAATSTATGGSYVDNDPGLRLNQQYCYYVETVGDYPAPRPQNLLNRSQEQCVLLAPRTCRPVLTLQGPDCDALTKQAQQYPSPLPRPLTYTNNLSWTLSERPEGCSADVVEYRILFSPSCDSTAFQEIGRTPNTFFAHAGLSSAGGCYRVLAVDAQGATAASNIAAGENCRIFVLPNVFSPNNDQRNDVFQPIFASPVNQVQVKIFNRWGAKVYEGRAGSDLTLWDGGGARSHESGGRDTGAKAAAGTYYYLLEVEFTDRSRQSYKGWVEIMR